MISDSKSIDPVELEDGIYPAIWCAYYVQILYPGNIKGKPIKVNNGIRGISKVSVTVKDKVLTINK